MPKWQIVSRTLSTTRIDRNNIQINGPIGLTADIE